jgi:hypothetical protein
MGFEEETRDAINRASAENESDTPDFVLARYLMDCLAAFETSTNRRTQWHGDGDEGESTAAEEVERQIAKSAEKIAQRIVEDFEDNPDVVVTKTGTTLTFTEKT